MLYRTFNKTGEIGTVVIVSAILCLVLLLVFYLLYKYVNEPNVVEKRNKAEEATNSINENKEYVKIQSCVSSYHRDRPTNCKNCGAVLTSYKCEYCGTEY